MPVLLQVRHWMWPLFTERWQLLRESLGQDPWPRLHQATQQQRQQQTVEAAHDACWSAPLCHAWPLLYGEGCWLLAMPAKAPLHPLRPVFLYAAMLEAG